LRIFTIPITPITCTHATLLFEIYQSHIMNNFIHQKSCRYAGNNNFSDQIFFQFAIYGFHVSETVFYEKDYHDNDQSFTGSVYENVFPAHFQLLMFYEKMRDKQTDG
jgi:hypothetical protein